MQTDMKDFIMNYALIITAIISLIGVSFAAIMSYQSNIKINQQKLKHEEKKLKQEFFQKSFDNLREASATLRERGIDGYNYEEVPAEIKKSINVFNSITPFISKENRDILEKIKTSTLGALYGGRNNDFRQHGGKLLEQLPTIIDEEILVLSDKLKEFSL